MGKLYSLDENKLGTKESSITANLPDKKYISVNISQGLKNGLKYTFHHSDGQRLNRDGILTVFNFKQPVEIPVTKLIGKWKDSYAGITVVTKDGKWQLNDKQSDFSGADSKSESMLKSVIAAVKKGIVKTKTADNFWEDLQMK